MYACIGACRSCESCMFDWLVTWLRLGVAPMVIFLYVSVFLRMWGNGWLDVALDMISIKVSCVDEYV